MKDTAASAPTAATTTNAFDDVTRTLLMTPSWGVDEMGGPYQENESARTSASGAIARPLFTCVDAKGSLATTIG